MTNRNRNSSTFRAIRSNSNAQFWGVSLIAVLVLFIFIAGPFISIWALNTLFGLGIAYNFWTWLAMVWTMMVIGGVRSSVGK